MTTDCEHELQPGAPDRCRFCGLEPTTTPLDLKHNNCITNDPCAICAQRCEPTGLDAFLAGTNALVCWACTVDAGYGDALHNYRAAVHHEEWQPI